MGPEEAIGFVLLRFGLSAFALVLSILAFRRAGRAVALPVETKNQARQNKLDLRTLEEKVIAVNNRFNSAAASVKKKKTAELEASEAAAGGNGGAGGYVDLSDPHTVRELVKGAAKARGSRL